MKFKLKLFLFKAKLKLQDWWNWSWAHLVAWLLAFIKLFPAKAGIGFFVWFAKTIGPFTSRQKITLNNLRNAYPEKNEKEIKAIALEMWENMGRLLAEYVFLDKIFDFDPEAETPGLVEVEGKEIFLKIRDEKKPHIFFTAHTGNFEMLPICAAAFDLNLTALFRPPNNPYIAKRVLKARKTNGGHLVPSKAGAVWALAGVLSQGDNVGVLVDQKFKRGIESTFYGLPVRTNPLLGKLARKYNCDVYPARCIRLPGGRYRLVLEDKIELPRDSSNEVDVNAVAQMLNDKVEQWVREYPGQWMWFHRRWNKEKK